MTTPWIAAAVSLVWLTFLVTTIRSIPRTRLLDRGMNLGLLGLTGFSATALAGASTQLGYGLGIFALLLSLSSVAFWLSVRKTDRTA